MKFAVFGVGGVGGVFGAALATAGHDVTFIARGSHLAAMRQEGLRIVGTRDFHILPTNATDDPSTADPVDVVLLTVKLWAVQEAAQALKPLLNGETAVVALQNGIDAERLIAQEIGEEHVMGGMAEISAAIEQPGVVRVNSSYTRLTFGEMDGRTSQRGEALEAACMHAGLEAHFTADIERALWEKFMLLAPISGLTSVTRATFGAVREDPDTRALLEDCIREVIGVAKAKGVDIEPNSFEKTLSLVEAVPAEGRASMAMDLELGNRLELPWLSGAVVRLGRELGVPTPTHEFINTVLKFHQDGRQLD